jgi:eukaryotic-like serine/threonine-protein kinase
MRQPGAYNSDPIPAVNNPDPTSPDMSSSNMSFQPGRTLGKYRIERELGRGGMGVVLLAYDPTLERQVAIKVLGVPGEPHGSRERVLLEARSASALNHPNICTVYEVGVDDGGSFIAMEYVDGQSLAEITRAGASTSRRPPSSFSPTTRRPPAAGKPT